MIARADDQERQASAKGERPFKTNRQGFITQGVKNKWLPPLSEEEKNLAEKEKQVRQRRRDEQTYCPQEGDEPMTQAQFDELNAIVEDAGAN
jgi:hypothetical protein